tara:strand:+ start:510 stop:905 length:396 start_codon:yes stop_codon:yes gene_type:complete
MSTLKVNTIQDASGGNSSTAEQIAQGRAKKWINYDGSNNSIRDDFGISSVTDHATGDFELNFDGNMANANYAVSAFVFRNGGGGKVLKHVDLLSSNSTSQLRFRTSGANNVGNVGLTFQDPEYVFMTLFGD